MSKIEIGRWSEQLRRMLGQKGQEEVAGSLSPEVSPTIELEGPTAEWAFLKRVRLAGAGGNIIATALTPGIARLRNPLNSTCIAVVTGVNWSLGATARVVLSVGQVGTDFPIAASGVLDSRWNQGGVTSRNALIVSSTNSAPASPGQVYMVGRAISNTLRSYDVPVVLMPGDRLELLVVQINIALSFSFAWRERSLPALER